MTTARNNNISTSDITRQYPNVAGNLINQGDLVYVDQTSYDIKALDTDAHAAYFCGVSNDTYKVGAYATEPVPYAGMNVTRKGRVKFILTSGVTVNPGQSVYIGANAQTVTDSASGSNTHAVGTVANLPDASQKALLGTGSNIVQVDVVAVL